MRSKAAERGSGRRVSHSKSVVRSVPSTPAAVAAAVASSGADFSLGDLVICRYSTYPYWPATIDQTHQARHAGHFRCMQRTRDGDIVLAYWCTFSNEDTGGWVRYDRIVPYHPSIVDNIRLDKGADFVRDQRKALKVAHDAYQRLPQSSKRLPPATLPHDFSADIFPNPDAGSMLQSDDDADTGEADVDANTNAKVKGKPIPDAKVNADVNADGDADEGDGIDADADVDAEVDAVIRNPGRRATSSSRARSDSRKNSRDDDDDENDHDDDDDNIDDEDEDHDDVTGGRRRPSLKSTDMNNTVDDVDDDDDPMDIGMPSDDDDAVVINESRTPSKTRPTARTYKKRGSVTPSGRGRGRGRGGGRGGRRGGVKRKPTATSSPQAKRVRTSKRDDDASESMRSRQGDGGVPENTAVGAASNSEGEVTSRARSGKAKLTAGTTTADVTLQVELTSARETIDDLRASLAAREARIAALELDLAAPIKLALPPPPDNVEPVLPAKSAYRSAPVDSNTFSSIVQDLRAQFDSFKDAVREAERARSSLVEDAETLRVSYKNKCDDVVAKESTAVTLETDIVELLAKLVTFDVKVMDLRSHRAGNLVRAIGKTCKQMPAIHSLCNVIYDMWKRLVLDYLEPSTKNQSSSIASAAATPATPVEEGVTENSSKPPSEEKDTSKKLMDKTSTVESKGGKEAGIDKGESFNSTSPKTSKDELEMKSDKIESKIVKDNEDDNKLIAVKEDKDVTITKKVETDANTRTEDIPDKNIDDEKKEKTDSNLKITNKFEGEGGEDAENGGNGNDSKDTHSAKDDSESKTGNARDSKMSDISKEDGDKDDAKGVADGDAKDDVSMEKDNDGSQSDIDEDLETQTKVKVVVKRDKPKAEQVSHSEDEDVSEKKLTDVDGRGLQEGKTQDVKMREADIQKSGDHDANDDDDDDDDDDDQEEEGRDNRNNDDDEDDDDDDDEVDDDDEDNDDSPGDKSSSLKSADGADKKSKEYSRTAMNGGNSKLEEKDVYSSSSATPEKPSSSGVRKGGKTVAIFPRHNRPGLEPEKSGVDDSEEDDYSDEDNDDEDNLSDKDEDDASDIGVASKGSGPGNLIAKKGPADVKSVNKGNRDGKTILSDKQFIKANTHSSDDESENDENDSEDDGNPDERDVDQSDDDEDEVVERAKVANKVVKSVTVSGTKDDKEVVSTKLTVKESEKVVSDEDRVISASEDSGDEAEGGTIVSIKPLTDQSGTSTDKGDLRPSEFANKDEWKDLEKGSRKNGTGKSDRQAGSSDNNLDGKDGDAEKSEHKHEVVAKKQPFGMKRSSSVEDEVGLGRSRQSRDESGSKTKQRVKGKSRLKSRPRPEEEVGLRKSGDVSRKGRGDEDLVRSHKRSPVT